MTDLATPVEGDAADETGGHDDHHDHAPTSLGLSNTKLAMWLFLGSECLLFGALISTYLLSKARFIAELTAGNPNVIESLLPEEEAQALADEGVRASISDLPKPISFQMVTARWSSSATMFSNRAAGSFIRGASHR